MITLTDICAAVRAQMRHGRVVPFLGAGLGRVGREEGEAWDPARFPPTGMELADHLAKTCNYPDLKSEPNRELSRIAQYAEFTRGQSGVALDLQDIFGRSFPPSTVHQLLASETRAAVDNGAEFVPFPVIMTTNYDTSLEGAFAAEHMDHDVLTYRGRRSRTGLWIHERDGVTTEISGDGDDALDPEHRTVILKLHGGINRNDRDDGSFVISDADYAGYVDNVLRTLPAKAGRSVTLSSFLFLGYALNDWNLRMFFLNVWRKHQEGNEVVSWAIEKDPQDFDVLFWSRFSVGLVEAKLEEWVDEMERGRS